MLVKIFILSSISLFGLIVPTQSVADMLLPSLSCSVSSLVPGNPSPFIPSMEGSCTSLFSCKTMSGMSLGRCLATNVCCAFIRTCDQRTYRNHTYFVNPLYPQPFNGTLNCALTIYKIQGSVKKPTRICQLRLDFLDFDINRPSFGNCDTDRLIISGQNANAMIPVICGRNSGQHMYVDVDNVQGPFTIRVMTSGSGYRRWNIKITQIECTNSARAPQNCLQYYHGPRGMFSSFNYESTQMPTLTTPPPNLIYSDASYLNNLDYAICFRKEAGFCSQTYTQNGTLGMFEIVNQGTDGTENFPLSQANAGQGRCPDDYLQLGGIRYCGSYINIAGLRLNEIRTNSPVIDATSGPFIARFRTNEHSVRRGFQVTYQQNPCGSILPTANIPTTAGG